MPQAQRDLTHFKATKLTTATLIQKFVEMDRDSHGSVLIRLIDEVGDEHWESIATHLLSEKLSEKRALSALTAVRSSMLPHLRWLALNSLSRRYCVLETMSPPLT